MAVTLFCKFAQKHIFYPELPTHNFKITTNIYPSGFWGAKRMTDTLREVIMPQFTRSVRYGKVPKIQQRIQITGRSAGN